MMVSDVEATTTAPALDIDALRRDFPILQRHIHGKPLVYFDNAATSQKPQVVIDCLDNYYQHYNSNIHRGVHTLSQEATAAYEGARHKIQHFLNAKSPKEIVFVRGTTEAINLVANSYGRTNIGQDDEIILSEMEHHANIVPWQLLCEQTGAKLKIIPINDQGELLLDKYAELFTPKTKLVAIVHVSNALGTINPIQSMVKIAHQHGVPVLVDGAQATPHMKVDVQALDCDFYTLSSHKMYGPTGVGALYVRQSILEDMPPYQGGGEMIQWVTFEKTTFNEIPFRFEAGTMPIADAIAFGTAIDYLQSIGLDRISQREQALLHYAEQQAADFPGLRIIGTAQHKASILSFLLDSIHAHDVGTILDNEGIAIRTGHHCAMPVMQHFHVPATARASFSFYNTFAEIDQLFAALHKVREVFAR